MSDEHTMSENKKLNKKDIFILFMTFLKIGACTFGGGYAMVPLIERELVIKKKWIDEKEILDIIAVSETTPGPIAVNTATFIGSRIAGFWGAMAATLGVVLPSFVIITVLAVFMRYIKDNRIVSNAFFGIRIGVLLLIFNALFTLGRGADKNVFSYITAAAAFILVAVFNVNALIFIIICALAGLINYKRRAFRK